MINEHDSYDHVENNDERNEQAPSDASVNPRSKEHARERVRRDSSPSNRPAYPTSSHHTSHDSGFVRRERSPGAPTSDRLNQPKYPREFSNRRDDNRAPSHTQPEPGYFNGDKTTQHSPRFNRRPNPNRQPQHQQHQSHQSNARFNDQSRRDFTDRFSNDRPSPRARPNIPNPLQTRNIFEEDKSVRLQKWLSEQGVGSRREVEEWIVNGDILIDGMVASLGAKIYGHEKIMLRGQPLNLRKLDTRSLEMLIYHKPAGEIVTYDDPHGRPTVFDHLPRPREGKWVSVGRLDFNSEGLLILTNSGDLAHRLMHPSFQLEREYAARIRGELSSDARAALLRGVPLEGEKNAAFLKIEDAGGRGSNHWYHVTLTEGRYREVRRMFEAVTYEVNRLIRIRYGKYQLPPQLRTGKFLRFKGEQVLELFEQIAGKTNRPTDNPINSPAARHRPSAPSDFRQNRERSAFSRQPNQQEERRPFQQRRSHFDNQRSEREEAAPQPPRKGFSGFLRSRGDRNTNRDGYRTTNRDTSPAGTEPNRQSPYEPNVPKHHDYD
jgi:23S rRNA pseudouridine2605 synthase